MQISRLFEIVYILLGRRHVTARELAERFEVSVRTIYRDVEALSMAGVPVYTTQGANGGIFISDTYVLNKSALTELEQDEILAALQSLSGLGHDSSGRLLSRMGSLFNKESADWLEVDFSRWGSEEKDRNYLSLIKRGILERHLLSFTYYGGSGSCTHRIVSPLKLSYKSRAWYIRAFCHDRQDYRTFKVVRMTGLTMLDETFERHALPPPREKKGESDDSSPALEVLFIEIRFQQSIAWRVWDEFDPAHVAVNDDGTLTVRVHFADEPWLYTYLLSFGAAAEVLSPSSLRASMLDTVTKIRNQYLEN